MTPEDQEEIKAIVSEIVHIKEMIRIEEEIDRRMTWMNYIFVGVVSALAGLYFGMWVMRV